MKELLILISQNYQNYEELKNEIIDFGHKIFESISDQKIDVAIYFEYKDF